MGDQGVKKKPTKKSETQIGLVFLVYLYRTRVGHQHDMTRSGHELNMLTQ